MTEREIFTAALARADHAERAAFLGEACAGDAALRERVESLLAEHQQLGSFMDVQSQQVAKTVDMPGAPLVAERAGTIIGPYKLLQQIGEGGMGTVYMAEQTKPVARRVAIKVIKPGMDTREVIARFESERQALAMMDHPNIAKVLDAGTTGEMRSAEFGIRNKDGSEQSIPHSEFRTPDYSAGRPYFVMELVKGFPITRYCDEHHLSLRERLELFVPVLQAVQHAHQKGIIHRDLKPSNVLIAEYDDRAVPKIIDFGVAKATGGKLTENTMFTQLGQLVGTLEYMSPEQAKFNQLDVDTRTDIYALGVLLYELLTGTTPFGRQRLHAAAFDEMLRILREEEPPKPSTRLTTIDNLLTVAANRHIEPARLSKFVRGELDWIVMKALEKDRNRRYETANGFASDVQRYLSDEAVQACPPSAAYRFHKLVQRNKGAFAFASTIAVGVLLAVVMLAVSYMRIARETVLKEQALKDKDSALTAAQASEKDANTKEGLAKAAQSEAQENLNDARAAVDQMLTRVSQERLLYIPQMEHVRRELLEDALKFYQKFLEKKGDDPVLRRETAWAYQRLARIQCSLGQLVEAEMSFRKAFATFEELEAQSPLEASSRADLARARIQFAGFLCELGKREEPEEHLRRAVQMAEDLVQEFPKDSAYDELLVVANLNLITLTRRPPDQEEEMLRRNLKLTKDTYLVGYIYWHLGLLGVRQGRYPEAKKDYLKALEKCETLASENPSSSSAQRDLGMVRVDLADAMAADGQREEAEPLYRRAIAILDKLANDYPGIHRHRAEHAGVQYKYATVLKTLDRTADAEQAYRRAVDLYAKLAADFAAIPAYQQIAFDQRLELGRFLVDAGRAQDAQQIYGEALALSGKLTADFPTRLNHWQGLVRSHIELGRLLERSGKTPAAEEAFRQALAISERLEAEHGGKPDYRREVARSHLDAAWILRFANRHSETEQLYRWALEHFVRLAGESLQSLEPQQDLAFAHFLLADYYRWAPGRLQDSEKLFRQALEEYQKLSADFPDVPGYHITSADCRERLASVLLYQGRLEEAELALEEALALAERLAEQHPADRTVRMTLAMGSRHWGETLWRMARPQEVEKAFRRSEAILEKLVADFPHESWYQAEWGLACQMFVALLARDLKQPQEAEEFYRRAVASFEKLAAEFPHDLSHRTRLAIVHREWASCLEAIGRTQEAKEIFELTITNFSKAIELGSKDFWGVWYPQALLHLSTGRTKEYRTLCERLLERFGQASDPDFWVVIICKLAPDALADLTRPVQFAEQMLARNPDDAELVGILGDTLYRKGDLDAAVQRLEASIRGAPGIGVHWRRLFLAMAYHRLGRTAEAQQLLTETTQWMEKNAQANLAEGAELSQPLAWQLRLDLQLLRQEAESLIASQDSY